MTCQQNAAKEETALLFVYLCHLQMLFSAISCLPFGFIYQHTNNTTLPQWIVGTLLSIEIAKLNVLACCNWISVPPPLPADGYRHYSHLLMTSPHYQQMQQQHCRSFSNDDNQMESIIICFGECKVKSSVLLESHIANWCGKKCVHLPGWSIKKSEPSDCGETGSSRF